MTVENRPESYITGLAGTFMGGRISGWVEKNRAILACEDLSGLEIELLDKLCPVFAEATGGQSVEEKARAVKEALKIADSSSLSATNYEPAFPGSMTLVRKAKQS